MNLKNINRVVGYLNEGLHVKYFKSEEIAYANNYKNGKLHGLQHWFFPSGNLREISEYQNGKRHGRCLIFHEDGKTLYRFSLYRGDLIFGRTIINEGGYISMHEFKGEITKIEQICKKIHTIIKLDTGKCLEYLRMEFRRENKY